MYIIRYSVVLYFVLSIWTKTLCFRHWCIIIGSMQLPFTSAGARVQIPCHTGSTAAWTFITKRCTFSQDCIPIIGDFNKRNVFDKKNASECENSNSFIANLFYSKKVEIDLLKHHWRYKIYHNINPAAMSRYFKFINYKTTIAVAVYVFSVVCSKYMCNIR